MGAIVSFYFGARYQVKGQDFQRSIAATVAQAPIVTANLRQLNALRALETGAQTAEVQSTEVHIDGMTRAQVSHQRLNEFESVDDAATAAEVFGASARNPALEAWRITHDE
jgi:hypothetical protein